MRKKGKSKRRFTSSTALLRERIERNLEEFKADVAHMDIGEAFELAPAINAAIDVHFYMTTHDWLDEGEADYFLQFDNPLRVMAYAWKDLSEERNAEFGKMLNGFTKKDGEYEGDYYGGYSVDDEDAY